MIKYAVLSSVKFKTSEGKVLFNAGDSFKSSNTEVLKDLLDNRVVMPVVEVIDSERTKLKEFIAGFTITSNEINESLPDVYGEIETLSEAFKKYRDEESLSACIERLEAIKRLYMWAIAVLKPEAVSILLYSKTLNSNVWVVMGDAEVQALRNRGIKEPIYTHDEVKILTGTPAHLRRVHEAKKYFGGKIIDSKRIES